MSPLNAVEEALGAWREAERELEALAPGSTAHAAASKTVAARHAEYLDAIEEAADVSRDLSPDPFDRGEASLLDAMSPQGPHPEVG